MGGLVKMPVLKAGRLAAECAWHGRTCERVMNRATEQQSLALQTLSYTAYGHSVGGPATSLRFNGEWRIGVLQGYGVGHGHRYYPPALMRFLSPDALSPFGKGGVNSYAYCQGDPVNRSDPTGEAWTIKRAPGRARPAAVFSPSRTSNETAVPALRNGPGKYLQASTVSKETVELSSSGSIGGINGVPVKVRPVATVAGVQSKGPTIDELGESRRNQLYWEHRPGAQPMNQDQMIPNHQRAHSSQILDIERNSARIREQEARDAIIVQLMSSWNG
ncbi:RHS repeat-associated core domain-containing protein [Pseudomonas sp. NBRC 111132]|uniref:RHS repeat-associated core domain-containing protein n=1 Tax=Pseudomonas sp. NBRC 111132 TaxID=1661047 RepID=UPI0015A753B0